MLDTGDVMFWTVIPWCVLWPTSLRLPCFVIRSHLALCLLRHRHWILALRAGQMSAFAFFFFFLLSGNKNPTQTGLWHWYTTTFSSFSPRSSSLLMNLVHSLGITVRHVVIIPVNHYWWHHSIIHVNHFPKRVWCRTCFFFLSLACFRTSVSYFWLPQSSLSLADSLQPTHWACSVPCCPPSCLWCFYRAGWYREWVVSSGP